MSHRVTTKTDITDKNLAVEALKAAGWDYTEEGNSVLRVTSGPMNRSTVNLRTGHVTGDTDWHSRDTLGALRQHYSEAQFKAGIRKSGAMIDSREVQKNGDIIYTWSGNVAAM